MYLEITTSQPHGLPGHDELQTQHRTTTRRTHLHETKDHLPSQFLFWKSPSGMTLPILTRRLNRRTRIENKPPEHLSQNEPPMTKRRTKQTPPPLTIPAETDFTPRPLGKIVQRERDRERAWNICRPAFLLNRKTQGERTRPHRNGFRPPLPPGKSFRERERGTFTTQPPHLTEKRRENAPDLTETDLTP